MRIYCSGRRGLGTGFLKTLSPGGMFVRILEPEVVGTRLHFEFRPDPKHPETVTGTAEVAFQRETYGGPGRPPGMGLRFVALTPEGSEMVTRITGEEVRVPVETLSPEAVGESASEGADPMVAASETIAEEAGGSAGGPPSTPREVESETPDRWEIAGDETSGERESTGFWLLLALLLVVAAAVFVPWKRPAPMAGPDELSGVGTVSSETSPAGDRGGREDSFGAPEGTVSEAPGPEKTEEASARNPDAGPGSEGPARRVEEIAWETGPSSLVVVVRGDGAFEDGRATYSHIGGENPRGVVRIRGMERASAGLRLAPESPLVKTIRTGFHTDGRAGGELHVVIDLADPTIRITGMVGSGTDLLVYLGRS